MTAKQHWIVSSEDQKPALAGFLRGKLDSWSGKAVKRLIKSGQVHIDGLSIESAGTRLYEGQVVEIKPKSAQNSGPRVEIVHRDSAIVVIHKPPNLSSVPFRNETMETAIGWTSRVLRRMGHQKTQLHVVHRIDKVTSGLLVFARTRQAEAALSALFRSHDIERVYHCVAHGNVQGSRIESCLVQNRGDGLRGSTRTPGTGKRAVTHVYPLEELRGATLCKVKLETGKTHQIRIHLAEKGHPLVGESVYIRDYSNRGMVPISSKRLLLHASTLGFIHPTTGEMIRFEAPLPPDFEAELSHLRKPHSS